MGYIFNVKKNKLKKGDIVVINSIEYIIIEQYHTKNWLIPYDDLIRYYNNINNLNNHTGRRYKNIKVICKDKRELRGVEVC